VSFYFADNLSSNPEHPSDSDSTPHQTLQFFRADGTPTRGLAHNYLNGNTASNGQTLTYNQANGDLDNPDYAKRYDPSQPFGGIFPSTSSDTAALSSSPDSLPSAPIVEDTAPERTNSVTGSDTGATRSRGSWRSQTSNTNNTPSTGNTNTTGGTGNAGGRGSTGGSAGGGTYNTGGRGNSFGGGRYSNGGYGGGHSTRAAGDGEVPTGTSADPARTLSYDGGVDKGYEAPVNDVHAPAGQYADDDDVGEDYPKRSLASVPTTRPLDDDTEYGNDEVDDGEEDDEDRYAAYPDANTRGLSYDAQAMYG
jgi:hypothetical protein